MSIYCYNCMNPIENYESVCPHCGQAPFGVNPVHQLKTGTLLKNRYLIGKSLGQGGFGITYIGLDTTLDVRVAVKEYYPNGISNRNHEASDYVTMTSTGADIYERGKLRFLQEAKTLARFYEEPGIVSVHDFFEDNNTAYIVMEYLDGITLKRFVEARGKIPANTLFRAMRPIMRSLEKVHAQDVIHRDISPDNIMLLRDGTLKLLDFGSAREVGGDKSLSVMLKPGYAPEEQYRSKGKQGPWTDIYALCATMYYCLTGVKPEESVERMVEDTLRRPSELDADITQAQESVILRGMAVHARERYQSMQELADALKGSPVRAVVPDTPEPTPPVVPNDEPKPRRHRKKNLILPIAGILTVVLLIFGGTKIFGALKPNPAISESVSTPVVTERPSPTPLPTPVPTPQLLTAEELKYIEAENLLASGDKAHAAMAFGALGDYKDARERSFSLWDEFARRKTIATSPITTLGIHSNGTVITSGSNNYGQCNVNTWSNIIAVETAGSFSVGLKSDGKVQATGLNDDGQCNTDIWDDIVMISVGSFHTVGLKTDGTVVAIGSNSAGQCNTTAWTDVVFIAAGFYHTIGIRADGTVLIAGDNYSSLADINEWTDLDEIATNSGHTVGLKKDGTVLAIGANGNGRCNVESWNNIVSISVGEFHTVGLKADGSVVAEGSNNDGQCEVSDWENIASISAGLYHTIGLKADGTVVAVGNNQSGQCNVSAWTDILLPAALPSVRNTATPRPTTPPTPKPTEDPNIPHLYIENATYPESMMQYGTANLWGEIYTDKGVIAQVCGRIYNNDTGQNEQICMYYPYEQYFSLAATINANLILGMLEPGHYTYIVSAIAENNSYTNGEEVLIEHSFDIYYP